MIIFHYRKQMSYFLVLKLYAIYVYFLIFYSKLIIAWITRIWIETIKINSYFLKIKWLGLRIDFNCSKRRKISYKSNYL